jgi:hypothetical protein
MIEPSPNSSESPELDPPVPNDKWCPSIRRVIVGLLFTLTVGYVFATIVYWIIRTALVHRFSLNPNAPDPEFLVEIDELILGVKSASLICALFVFPLSGLGLLRGDLQPRPLFVVGVQLLGCFQLLLIGLMLHSWYFEQARHNFADTFLKWAIMSLLTLGVFSPLFAFALYLAYVRRRDLRPASN